MRRRPPSQGRTAKRGNQSRQLNPILQRELKRANHLMQKGEHRNAAQIFQQLGENSQDKGILFPAAMLYMQAATAFLLASKAEQALDQARRGLELLGSNNRWRAYSEERTRILQAFEDGGYEDEAAQISKWSQESNNKVKEKISEPIASDNEIPSKCPYCGASLSLEQIKNTRHSVTECKYCGSFVVAGQID
jgi:hypothetical protein